MADNVWIVGAAMTKFGRYPEKDVVDLASDVSLDAMGDAGATIHDMNVLAVGSQFEMFTLGQRIQKQIGQTGIPVYNVSNACATGASAVRTVIMAIKAGEADDVLVGEAPELRHRRPHDPHRVCHHALSCRLGSKPNATASVPSSSTPATNVVIRTDMPSFTCSGSGGMFERLAFTVPPPSRSTSAETYGAGTPGTVR